MRSRALTWSITTLFVNGSFLPLAIRDSSRSTRKMMSIGPALPGCRVLRGLCHSARRGRDRRGARFQRVGRGLRDELVDGATELGDLAHDARAHVAVLQRRHEEDRVDLGRELAVRVPQLELRFEVRDGAQAADDKAGVMATREVDGETGEAL